MSIHAISHSPSIMLKKGEVKLIVVAAPKSRSAAYFVYGCQKFYINKLMKQTNGPVTPWKILLIDRLQY
jgi:hypothetical protein